MRVDLETGEILDLVSGEGACAGPDGASATDEARASACPPLLTGGESPSGGRAVIDWLSFTFTEWQESTLMPMMLQLLSVWCGRTVGAEPANGRHGFKQSQLLYVFHEHKFVPVGVMAWGGEQQRGRAYVSLNGTWCSLIDSDMWPVVRGWIESVRATLTRVDLAADFVNGEYSIEDAVDWYRAGEFNAGGRMPKHSCEGDWLHSNPIGGRTLYVGKRGNGKFSRLYEKGKQLGNADSPWMRFECELGNRDRILPHDIITRPTEYFAGQYKVCARIVDAAAARIRTTKLEGEITIGRLKAAVKTSYGRFFHVLRLMTPDHARLVDELAVEGVPSRLAKFALHDFLHPKASETPTEKGPPPWHSQQPSP